MPTGLSSLPDLNPSDPENCLSDAARRRISKAYVSAKAIRAKAKADANARVRAGKRVDAARDELERRKASLDSVRLILRAMLKEYSGAREDAIRSGRIGESGWNLREIMALELDGLASSAGLTDIDRHMIELELAVDVRTATEEAADATVANQSEKPRKVPAGKSSTGSADATTRARRRKLLKDYLDRHSATDNFTMADLARRIGSNVTAIQGMVRGDRTRYSQEHLLRVLKFIRVTPDQW